MRTRIESARLYAICDVAALERVPFAHIDVLQLREKTLRGTDVVDGARRARTRCRETDTIFIVNDDPHLAVELEADGVHVGQDDLEVAAARAIVGSQRLVGLSTHTPEQIDAAHGADYIGVGPIFATPTKPGRPAVGLDLVRYAAEHSHLPFFAIGGIDTTNVALVHAAGAERIAVVRALTQAADPAAAAGLLREEASGALAR